MGASYSGDVDTARRPLVGEVVPTLAEELVAGLHALGRSDLADQVSTLEVWGRCGCPDDFCSSFYTGPRSTGTWQDEGEHENVVPEGSTGMLILDVVAGVIRFVEVLDRPDIKAVIRTFPALTRPEPSDPAGHLG